MFPKCSSNYTEEKKKENLWDIRKFDRKFIIEFIELYESLPSLWDIRSPEYNNRAAKSAGYEKLVNKFKEVDPDANRELVTRKINSLRTNFRKDLRRFREFVKVGIEDKYVPKTWYFNHMKFLQSLESSNRHENETGDGSIDEGESGLGDVKVDVKDESNEASDLKMPDVCQILINMANDSHRREDINSSRGRSESNDELQVNEQNEPLNSRNVFNHRMKQTSFNRITSTVQRENDKIQNLEISNESAGRSQRINTKNWSISGRSTNTNVKDLPRKNIPGGIYNSKHDRKKKSARIDPDKLFLETLQRISGEESEYDILARCYSFKLSKMTPTQRIYADKLIHEVLMEGLLGNLRRDSSVKVGSENSSCNHISNSINIHTNRECNNK